MCRAKDDVAASSLEIPKGREVLPTNVKPLHYDLTLEPDFEKFTYEGKVVIEYVLSMTDAPVGTSLLWMQFKNAILDR